MALKKKLKKILSKSQAKKAQEDKDMGKSEMTQADVSKNFPWKK